METDDLAAVAALEHIHARNQGMRWVGYLENHWCLVSLIVVGLMASIATITFYGIPTASRVIAGQIPPQLIE